MFHEQNTTAGLNHKLDLLLRTGCLLMESAADTSRVIRNMKRIAVYLGLPEENLHIYVSCNMLMANLSDDTHSYTKFKRCERHGIDMTTISRISNLSWQAIKEGYSTEQYEKGLDNISRCRRNYPRLMTIMGGGFACGGFCIQFGCDWAAFMYASIAAITGFGLLQWLGSKGSNTYVNIGMATFISTLTAWTLGVISTTGALPSFMVSSTPWHPLMACALFIVPGVPLINFVNDMLSGYVQNGITRAANTLMSVLAMAFGIAFAIQICGIDNFVKDLSMTPHHNYIEYSVAAAISAMGFSMIFNIPKRLLWVVATGGIIAVCTRNFVCLGASSGNIGLNMGPIIGSLAGSALISIICTRIMRRLHTPHHCISIPSVIPMIPGVLMYRALFAFIDMHGVIGEVTTGMNNAIRASLIILCISVGVAIPNIFFRSMTFPKREQKLLDILIKRRKRHGLFIDLNKMR